MGAEKVQFVRPRLDCLLRSEYAETGLGLEVSGVPENASAMKLGAASAVCALNSPESPLSLSSLRPRRPPLSCSPAEAFNDSVVLDIAKLVFPVTDDLANTKLAATLSPIPCSHSPVPLYISYFWSPCVHDFIF